MTVFLDTVGMLAVWNQNDQWHSAARKCFNELLADRANLVTTSFVLLECGNALARRPYRSSKSLLREQLEQGNRLIIPTAEDWRQAWAAYDSHRAESAGIVDHVSFVAMRRLEILKVFTNDRHFKPLASKHSSE
jgi:predicted nucleic acid-binding protein